jgi:hypothetical protein
MALHKLIEDTCREEFPVAASSLLAGCYALSAMMDPFCQYDEDYPEHQIAYWKLRSMARVYGLKRPFDRTVVSTFAAALARDVLADTAKNPRGRARPRLSELLPRRPQRRDAPRATG